MSQVMLLNPEHIEIDDDNRDSWCTPAWLVGMVVAFFDGAIDLDPCSNSRAVVPATVRYTVRHDGLAQDWTDHRRVYLNPPYSDHGPWLARGQDHARTRPREVVALIKGDWSTQWWNSYVRTAPRRCLIARRVAYTGRPGNSNNFASALVYYGHRPDRFAETFAPLGEIV